MDAIKNAMNLARSNIKIEGLYIPKIQEQLIEQLLRREISEAEYFIRVLEIVKK